LRRRRASRRGAHGPSAPADLCRPKTAFSTRKPVPPNCLPQPNLRPSIRSPADLDRLLALHATRTAPLITLWTATWCRSCGEIAPLVRALVEHEYAGLDRGGVGFAAVELDAPTIGDLGARCAVASVPALLAFHGGEPRRATMVTAVKDLEDAKFVTKWIEREAEAGRKGAGRGGAGKWLAGIFGS
jgi:hypothetical protein